MPAYQRNRAAPDPALLQQVAGRLPTVRPDRKDEYWIECPKCGKGDKHFSFSLDGGRCFHCGWKASLVGVARAFGVLGGADYVPPPPAVATPPRPARPVPPWQADGAGLISRAMTHQDRLTLWQVYKPLTRATLDKHRFGVGPLTFQRASGEWYTPQQEWLLVPLFERGALVGLRGRKIGDGPGHKWLSATGTRYCLFNADSIRAGGVTWVCENYVDAAWLAESYPEFDGVAIGGASTWRDEWAAQVAAKRPKLVVVALDNDLAGQASGTLRQRLCAEWRAEHPDLPLPPPGGPRIADSLRAAGVRAVLYEWPVHAPAKADIGWHLAHGERP